MARTLSRDDEDPLAGLQRELRGSVGAELRADAEDAERLAALAALRGRDLEDVGRDLQARGAEVAVLVAGRRFRGAVARAAGDLLVLRTGVGEVDVRLSAATSITVAGRGAPTNEPPTGAGSFRARLYEHEMVAARVRIGLVGSPDELHGRIRAVASDHVLAVDDDGTEHVIPAGAVAYVVPET